MHFIHQRAAQSAALEAMQQVDAPDLQVPRPDVGQRQVRRRDDGIPTGAHPGDVPPASSGRTHRPASAHTPTRRAGAATCAEDVRHRQQVRIALEERGAAQQRQRRLVAGARGANDDVARTPPTRSSAGEAHAEDAARPAP